MFNLISPLQVVIAYPAVPNRPKLLGHSKTDTCMDQIVNIVNCCHTPIAANTLVAQPQFNDVFSRIVTLLSCWTMA